MKTAIYKTIDQKVLKEWQALWEKSPIANYSNGPHWFLSAIESFSFTDYVIIALYKKEKLTAIGAFVKEKKYGLTFYTNAPSDFVCGIPFLMDSLDTKIVGEFTKQLLAIGNIFLSNIPEDFLAILRKQTHQLDAIEQSVNYFLSVQKDKEGLAVLSKRKRLVKQIKDYEEKFSFRTFDGNTKEGLEIAFRLDKQSSKHEKGYNTFNTLLMQKFFIMLAHNFGENFIVNILYFENKPIAYEIGFFVKETYYGSQLAYNFDYRQYSPGKVILVNVADFLAFRNATMWDLGSGESSVKHLITEEKRQLYQLIISKNKNVRTYCNITGKLKNYGFEQSKHHVKIYSAYRKMRNLLAK